MILIVFEESMSRLGLFAGWMVLIIQCEEIKVVSKTHW